MKWLALLLTGLAAYGQGPAPVRSPEVHPDRTVTFRLRAPQATSVEVTGEVARGKGPPGYDQRLGWCVEHNPRALYP